MIDKSIIFGEDLEDIDDDFSDSDVHGKKYTCGKCGSSFCWVKGKKSNRCIFCGTPSLDSDDYVEERPLSVVPFEKTIEDVERDFKKKVGWNPLIPFTFRRRKNLQNIKKVFLPAYLVNANQTGRIVFLAGDKERIIYRGRKCLQLKKYEVYNLVNFDYKGILLNVCTKVNNKIFVNICDYHYDNMEEFDASLMKDAIYVLGDVEATQIGNKERERIAKYSLLKVRNAIDHSLKKFKSDDTSVVFHDAQEVLLPVYIVNVSYHRKNYTYYMNGQNGKSYIELPVGILEIILFVILVGGIIFAIIWLIVYYL